MWIKQLQNTVSQKLFLALEKSLVPDAKASKE